MTDYQFPVNHMRRILFSLTLLASLLLPSIAFAESHLHLRVDALDATIFDADLPAPAEPCVITDSTGAQTTLPATKAFCAFDAAAKIGGFLYTVNPTSFGLYLAAVNGIAPSGWDGWLYEVNGVQPWVGMDTYDVAVSDTLRVFYSVWPWKIEASATSTTVSAPVTFTALAYSNNAWNPAPSAALSISGETFTADALGQVVRTFSATGTIEAYIVGEWGQNSPSVTVSVSDPEPPPPQGTIAHVMVSHLGQSWFDQIMAIGPVAFADTDGAVHTITSSTAMNGLVQASAQGNFPVEIQNGAFGLYVRSVSSTPAVGWDGWVYEVNGTQPWVGMAEYLLQENDLLRVFYSVWPWKIEAAPTSTATGEPVTFTAYQYAENAWILAVSSTVRIGEETVTTDSQGQVARTFSASSTIESYILGEWGQNSPSVFVQVAATSTLPEPPPAPPAPTGGSNPPAQSPPSAEILSAVDRALGFLRSIQQEGGMIENAGVSDWSAMAFGTKGVPATTVKKGSHTLADALQNGNPTTPTDYARHILARKAGGMVLPQSLLDGLMAAFDGTQIGDPALLNDDIFGIMALVATGKGAGGEATKSARYLIAKQRLDGSFGYSVVGPGDVDDTAAAVQALVAARNAGAGINAADALLKAKTYLKTQQMGDGGFPYSKLEGGPSNSASTAWVLQAIGALGETDVLWTAGTKTPASSLLTLQQGDGSFAWYQGQTSLPALMTAYAVPGLLGMPWPILQPEYLTPQNQTADGASGGEIPSTIQPTATSTPTKSPTSTPSSILPLAKEETTEGVAPEADGLPPEEAPILTNPPSPQPSPSSQALEGEGSRVTGKVQFKTTSKLNSIPAIPEPKTDNLKPSTPNPQSQNQQSEIIDLQSATPQSPIPFPPAPVAIPVLGGSSVATAWLIRRIIVKLLSVV